MEAELQKIKNRKEDERNYYVELDDLRAEALHGLFSDILDAIPTDVIFKKMHDMLEYRKIAVQLHTAYAALRAAAQLKEGISANADQDRVHDILGASLRARDALLLIPVDELEKNDPARLYLKNFARFYDASVKVLEFYLQHRDRKLSWPELTNSVKLTIDLAGLWVPPVKLGAQLESFGERGAKLYLARLAAINLDGVLVKESLAELYLRQRLDGVNSFLSEEERTLSICSRR